VDAAQLVNFAMDLTPLIDDDQLDPEDYVIGFIDRFRSDVSSNIRKFKKD